MARIIYNKVTKHVVMIVEDITSNIAASDENEVLTAESLELCRVLLKRMKGEDILNRFISENEQIEIPTLQNVEMLQALMPIKQMLEAGAITSAMEIAYNTPLEVFPLVEPYVTSEDRKNSYIIEMSDFIQSLT